MEPVRGGALANLPEESAQRLKALRPEESIPAWSFRFLQDLPNVKMILSGMSNLEQMEDNIKTFQQAKPLTSDERNLLLEIAEPLKGAIPCTACRYCCDGCPAGLNIPVLLSLYNGFCITPHLTVAMAVESFPPDKRPSACIGCGKCTQICPQSIDIPGALKAFADGLAQMPSWEETCRQREAEGK
jgi:predicted aldo/keto reductase-like oxidoreductase